LVCVPEPTYEQAAGSWIIEHPPERLLSGLVAGTLAISLSSFAIGLSGSTDSSRMLARTLFGRFLEVPTKLHLAVNALALKLLL
jgi:hypothetical protein